MFNLGHLQNTTENLHLFLLTYYISRTKYCFENKSTNKAPEIKILCDHHVSLFLRKYINKYSVVVSVVFPEF